MVEKRDCVFLRKERRARDPAAKLSASRIAASKEGVPASLVDELEANSSHFGGGSFSWTHATNTLRGSCLTGGGIGHLFPPVQRALRRVQWSKEASSFGFVYPYWSIGIKLICYWIIDAMVEAIIR